MSIDDDIALLEGVQTLRLLGADSLRMLAIGSEQRKLQGGETLFRQGDTADCGFVVQRGTVQVNDNAGAEVTAGPGTLIGELALVVEMQRPSTATATEPAIVVRISRSLFQRLLESDPVAARRLRELFATRASQMASDILVAAGKLTS